MHILYVGARFDYGEPARGLSFEHCNFYDTLVHMGHDITYFDFMTEYQRSGRTAMSLRLLDIVKSDKPDLLFSFLFKDELDIDIIRCISARTETVTFNWFADDHWRFNAFSRHWAPAFNWVSTTAASALPKYRRIGYANVIKTQWACNHFSYRPLDLQPLYDVTFVGQPHGTRRETVDALRTAGINVQTWGYGWDTGRVSQMEMIEIFGRSRVNLNLSNASWPTVNMGWRSRLPWSSRRLARQIKGRNFEVPGCHAFLLTEVAENLGQYYVADHEVATFVSTKDLVHKVGCYLNNEPERQRISEAGYRRTLRQHTYEKRFNEIFATIGMTPPATQRVDRSAEA